MSSEMLQSTLDYEEDITPCLSHTPSVLGDLKITLQEF